MTPALLPIVEGQSEVKGLRGLLNRVVCERPNPLSVSIAAPFLVKRQRVVKPDKLEAALTTAVRLSQERGFNVQAILVLLDADNDCPAELARQLNERAAGASPIPVRVVFPDKEIENWLLGSPETLRTTLGIEKDLPAFENPEAVTGVPGRISDLRPSGIKYRKTRDLPALLQALDMDLCKTRCRSFRKFVKEVEFLAGEMTRGGAGGGA